LKFSLTRSCSKVDDFAISRKEKIDNSSSSVSSLNGVSLLLIPVATVPFGEQVYVTYLLAIISS
jgi:hypothetical protein